MSFCFALKNKYNIQKGGKDREKGTSSSIFCSASTSDKSLQETKAHIKRKFIFSFRVLWSAGANSCPFLHKTYVQGFKLGWRFSLQDCRKLKANVSNMVIIADAMNLKTLTLRQPFCF